MAWETLRFFGFLVSALTLASSPATAQYAPGSKERLYACLKSFDPKSLELAECWEGKRETREEFCLQAGRLLGNDYLKDWQKLALYEKMRNNGCLN